MHAWQLGHCTERKVVMHGTRAQCSEKTKTTTLKPAGIAVTWRGCVFCLEFEVATVLLCESIVLVYVIGPKPRSKSNTVLYLLCQLYYSCNSIIIITFKS